MSEKPYAQLPLMFAAPSLHDLPPKWDGRRVEWSAWDTSPTFICGPRSPVKREPCEECRSVAQPATCRGVVFPLAGETVEAERIRRSKSGLEYVKGTMMVPVRPHVRLFAFRCPDCGLDTVLDLDDNEYWTLDDSDYGDKGSVAP